MEVQIAVAKVNKYATSESGDTLEVVERPNGGLSVVLADGQTSGRGAKAVSQMVVRKVIRLHGHRRRDEPGGAARGGQQALPDARAHRRAHLRARQGARRGPRARLGARARQERAGARVRAARAQGHKLAPKKADVVQRYAKALEHYRELAQWLQQMNPEQFGFLRVFQYLTFRAVMAAMTALLLGLLLGPYVIRRLTELKIGQPIREYAIAGHMVKHGTPTMGGALVLLAIALSTLLWYDWSNRFVWIVMIVTFGFGAIGWVDDWRKVVDKNPEGMRSREKFFWQSLIGLLAAIYLAFSVSEVNALRVAELFFRIRR